MKVSKEPGRIRDMFDAVAPKYDRLNHALSAGVDILWREHIAQLIPRGGNALDLCCGTGDLAHSVERPSRTTVGLDFSGRMLEIARKKYPNVRFVHADATVLPFKPESFSCATVGFGIRNVVDYRKTMQEVLRVLRKRGKFVILEFAKGSGILNSFYEVYLQTFVPVLGNHLSSTGAYTYLRDSVKEWISPKALASELSKAGFSSVHFQKWGAGGIVFLVATK